MQARETSKIPTLSQLKQFPTLLSKNERSIAVAAFLLFAVTSVGLLYTAFNAQRVDLPAHGGSYTEGLIGAPQLINPLYSLSNDVDHDFVHLIYSGLLRYDSVEGLVPDLASSYTVSEDGTEYTFVLRDHAKWHNGKPVTIDDVIFTYTAIQNPEYRSPLQVSFANVDIVQVDEQTVTFVLDEPFAPFLSLMTTGLLPAHLWQNINPQNASIAEYNRRPIGSGPYVFDSLEKEKSGAIRSYTLKRFTDYYGTVPYIDTLQFKFYPDLFSATEALRNKNVEGLSYLSLDNVERFENEHAHALYFPSITQYTAAFINQNNAVLQNDDVREALQYAIDKQRIVDEAVLGHANPISSFILPGMLGAQENQDMSQFDPNTAATLLEEAEWIFETTEDENGATTTDTVRSKDGTELAFTITTIDTPELRRAAEILAEDWNAIGANVTVSAVSQTTFQSDTLKNRAYDILISGELYGIDPDPYAFWHSSQTQYPGLNLSGFSNRNADDLIETARTTTDATARAEAYQELQDIVAEEIPAFFLYQPQYSYATSSKIQNIELETVVYPAHRFSNITNWFIKTKKVFRSRLIDTNGDS